MKLKSLLRLLPKPLLQCFVPKPVINLMLPYFWICLCFHWKFKEKIEDPSLYFYAICFDSVLITYVIVNSTVHDAKKPEKD